jgi:hypothetical protein
MTHKGQFHGGQRVRQDSTAPSTSADLPAFIARPADAPVYYGFPILAGSAIDGFEFGTITEPSGGEPASWGDAFVVAPDGSRAGIVWVMEGPDVQVVLPPEPGRWGVYQFRFEIPVKSDADLIRNLHAVLPRLKEFYAAAQSDSRG